MLNKLSCSKDEVEELSFKHLAKCYSYQHKMNLFLARGLRLVEGDKEISKLFQESDTWLILKSEQVLKVQQTPLTIQAWVWLYKERESPPRGGGALLLGFTEFGCCCCSVSKSHLTVTPTDCSTPGFLFLHHLLEFAQVLIHWVGDAIQSSHPLLVLLLPSIFPIIRVFSNESALLIR